MKENPINDPLIELTPEELSEILRTRKRHPDLSPGYPRTGGGFALTPCGRLWYVAEFIIQAKAHKRTDPTAYQAWRARAHVISQEVVRLAATPEQYDIEPFCELLRHVAAALEGKRREIVTTARENAYQEVMRTVAKYCGVHGELPTHKALMKFAKCSGIRINKNDVTEVFKTVQIKFPTTRKR